MYLLYTIFSLGVVVFYDREILGGGAPFLKKSLLISCMQ